MQVPRPGTKAGSIPDVFLLVRWAWRMAEIFDPEALEPGVRYDDHQLFWQRNLCADGVKYVQGVSSLLCCPCKLVMVMPHETMTCVLSA